MHKPVFDLQTQTWDEATMEKVRNREWTLLPGGSLVKSSPPDSAELRRVLAGPPRYIGEQDV